MGDLDVTLPAPTGGTSVTFPLAVDAPIDVLPVKSRVWEATDSDDAVVAYVEVQLDNLPGDGGGYNVRLGNVDPAASGNEVNVDLDVGAEWAFLDFQATDGAVAARTHYGVESAQAEWQARLQTVDGASNLIKVSRLAAVDKIGFFNKTPAARPVVPATPTAQDVVDALVTLGLVTQAP